MGVPVEVFVVWVSTIMRWPGPRGSGEADLARRTCFSARRFPLPLGSTDWETEFHRPRGAAGFLRGWVAVVRYRMGLTV